MLKLWMSFNLLRAPQNNLKVNQGHVKVTNIAFKTKFRQNILKKEFPKKIDTQKNDKQEVQLTYN